MAGIQLPQLQRLDTPDAPPGPRLNPNMPNLSEATAPMREASTKLGADIENYAQKALDDQVVLTATDARNSYEGRYKGRLSEIKEKVRNGADPTTLYSKLDEERESWKNEINDQYQDVNPRTQQAITEGLHHTDSLLTARRQVDESIATIGFRKRTAEAYYNNRADSMVDGASIMSMQDPTTFHNFQDNLSQMKDQALQEASAYGLDHDPEMLSNFVRSKTSPALRLTVQTLNNAGKTQEAKKLMDEYADDITAKDHTYLSADHTRAGINNQALVKGMKLNTNMSFEQANEIAYRDVDPNDPAQIAVAEKMMGSWHTKKAHMVADQNNSAKQSMKEISGIIANSNFKTLDELHSSPAWIAAAVTTDPVTGKPTKFRFDGKQQAALEQMVVQPERTTKEAMATMVDNITNDKLSTMSSDEFMVSAVGMSRADRATYEKRWMDAKNPTNAAKNAMSKQMLNSLPVMMQQSGMIKLDSKGKVSGRGNSDLLNQMKLGLQEEIETKSPNMNPEKWDDYVKNYLSRQIKNKNFKPAEDDSIYRLNANPRSTVAPTAATPSATPAPTALQKKATQKSVTDLPDPEATKILIAYKAANKGVGWKARDGKDVLDNWARTNGMLK